MSDRGDQALLIGMPIDDLRAALDLQERRAVILPAGGPGDLGAVAAGTPVLFIASDPAHEGVPAATWRAELVRLLPHVDGDPVPDGLPPTWLARHADQDQRGSEVESLGLPDDEGHEDDDGDEDDEEITGPQSFFEVSALRELPKSEWLFANELVGKQARRGRTFFPLVPILVHLPD